MDKFWKIPKEWVQEWGLSWNEAGIIADILDWNCTTHQHAVRCVVSDRTVKNALDNIAAKAEANEGLAKLLDLENFSVFFSKSNGKFFQKKRKIFPKKAENFSKNFSNPPTPPYYIKDPKEQEEQRTSRDNARTREEPENFSDKNSFAAEPAPTPQPPAPTSPDSVLVKRVSEWEQEHRAMIAQGSEWANSLYRLYKITSLQLNDYLTLFTDHCTAQGEEYKTLTDYRKHLTSWLRYRATNNNIYGKSAATPQQRREVTRSTEPAGADF